MKGWLLFFFTLCRISASPVLSSSCPACASDQYCDTNSCVCNSTLYSASVNPPSPVIDCSDTMTLTVPKCQLEKNRYSSASLHLVNSNCQLQERIVGNLAQMVYNWTLGDCGNSIIVNSSHVTYANKLYIYAQNSIITNRNNVTLTFSCTYPLNMSTSLNFPLKTVFGSAEITVPNGEGTLTVTMTVYTDPSFSQYVTSDTVLAVAQPLYVSVLMPSLVSFSVKVTNIYATETSDPSVGSKVYLLENGCKPGGMGADLMSTLQNGNYTESRFVMRVFQFANMPSLYLFADVTVCNGTCIPECSSRSGVVDRSAGTQTVSVYLESTDTYSAATTAFGCFSSIWTLNSILFSLILSKLM
ncbi:uromodulin [Xenopus tropicalis]|uniref:Thyroid hormone down-regulated protein (gene 17) n=1 Tax=Xenopus tropicalis TaxID=8364 RepID=F6XTF4_XENTR|nr:uromodulin [Xenopus tropicalis]